MPNLVLVTWTTQLLVWLCSWAHWYDTLSLMIGLVEIAILVRMLRLDRQNHHMYREFFQARTEYYNRRYRKTKPPDETPGGDMLDVLVEDSLTSERIPPMGGVLGRLEPGGLLILPWEARPAVHPW